MYKHIRLVFRFHADYTGLHLIQLVHVCAESLMLFR